MKKRNPFLFAATCAVLLAALLLLIKRLSFPSEAYSGIDKAFWIVEPLFLTAFFFALAAACRKNYKIYLCIGLGSICLFFAAAETYFRLFDPELKNASAQSAHMRSGEVTHTEEDLYARDRLLGAALKKQAMRAAHRRVHGPREETIFDVIYSVNADGRRVTPERGGKADTAVLLFGCSMTFGNGVNDKDTYAWKLAEALGEKYQVINLGVSGYGAQQMLALLESGRLAPIFQQYKHIHAFFLTISDHLNRCTGFASWVKRGPRYILEKDRAVYGGDFADTLQLNKIFDKIFLHSAFYPVLRSGCGIFISRQALALHTALLADSAKKLAERHVPLTVLVWPDFPQATEKLRARSVPVLPLAPAMPDWNKGGQGARCIFPYDGHITPLGHEIVARELLRHFTRKTPDTPPSLQ